MKELTVEIRVEDIIYFAKLIMQQSSIEFLYRGIHLRKCIAEPCYPINVFKELRLD